MKASLIITALLFSHLTFAQTENPDFENLIALGEIYSKNVNATGDEFKIAVEKLRTPGLNHIIDGLIASGEGDVKLLSKEFLSKPDQQELQYWYVIREIHYNNTEKVKTPRPVRDVALEFLNKKIDERWLLDNYYYRIISGVGRLFNKADLSTYNIDLNELNLKNDTEKAILYFSLSDALITRFRVLQMVKNNDKLLEFAGRLPAINGKPYYEYTAFGFEDFDWVGYEKMEPFKYKHLGLLYGCIAAHFGALVAKEEGDKARALYFHSILSMPEYFKYADKLEKDLKELYEKSKK